MSLARQLPVAVIMVLGCVSWNTGLADPPAKPPTSEETVKQADTAYVEALAFVKKFTAALAEVKDQKTADATAAKLKVLKKEQDALVERADGLKLDKKSYEKVSAKHEKQFEAAFEALVEQMKRLEKEPELLAPSRRLSDRMLIAIGDCIPSPPREEIDPTGGTVDADWSLKAHAEAGARAKPLDLPAEFKAHDHGVYTIALSGDGKWLATSSYVGVFAEKKHAEIRVWEVATGALVYSLTGYPGGPGEEIEVTALAFTPDGQQLVSSGNLGLLKFWDLKNRKPGPAVKVATATEYLGIKQARTPVASSADGRFFVACRVGGFDLFEVATGKRTSASADPLFPPKTAAISPDGKLIATFMEDYFPATSMRMWDAEKRTSLWSIGNGHDLRTLRFTAGGKTLLAFDHTSFELARYDVETGNVQKAIKVEMEAGKHELRLAHFVSDDRLVICEHLHGAALYDCATGAKLQMLEEKSDVSAVSSSTDGTLLALDTYDKVRLLRLAPATAKNDPKPANVKKPQRKGAEQPVPQKDSELREWKSANGRFSVKAKFLKLVDTTVHLEREDGEEIQVSLDKLRKEDQAWVRSRK